MEIIRLLSPRITGLSKIRVGNSNDGGYVIIDPRDLRMPDVLYSYGIGDDISFEMDFRSIVQIPVHMYDHTIKKPIHVSDSVHWHNIKATPEIFSNIRENSFVKMDIEGDEYDIFRGVSESVLSRANQLVVEYHHVGGKYIDVYDKISRIFYLVHVHGNNFSNLDSNGIPRVLECTYINKEIYHTLFDEEPKFDPNVYPTSMDSPNKKIFLIFR